MGLLFFFVFSLELPFESFVYQSIAMKTDGGAVWILSYPWAFLAKNPPV